MTVRVVLMVVTPMVRNVSYSNASDDTSCCANNYRGDSDGDDPQW